MQRPIFPGVRITWGSLTGAFMGWVLGFVILKSSGRIVPVGISYSFAILTGLFGAIVVLMIAFAVSRLRNKP